MKLRGLAIGAICTLAPSLISVAAAAPAVNPVSEWRLSQLNRRVWQIEDGLPHNYVTAISADEKGYLLLGTQSGIARFDGMRFTPFEHLGGRWIYAMLKASDGAFWVGGYRNGLHLIRDGKLRTWSAAEGVGDGTVFSFLEDRSHQIWAVSFNGLMRCDPEGPRMIVHGGNVDGYNWQSVSEDDTGAIWFAAREGLFRITGGRAPSQPLHLSGAQGLPVTVYYSAPHRQLYLGTTTGLYSLKCSAVACDAAPIPGVRGPVVLLRATSDDTLWAGTWGNGIFRVAGHRVEQISSREGLADDFVRVLSEDSEHNLWAGTRSGGLTRFRQTPLKPYGIPEGLGGNYASAVVGDGADGLWLGTWRSGLFHWRNGLITPRSLPEPPLNLLITSLALDTARDLWLGTLHGVLWKLRNGAPAAERIPIPNADRELTSILAARDRSLWLAKRSEGLLHFASGDPRTSAPVIYLRGESVTALLEDRDSRIWIGAESGLWRIGAAPGRRLELLQQGAVSAISQDSRGRIWGAANTGQISLFTEAGATPIRFAGLPAPQVYLIADDTRFGLWIGTGRGLARASLNDVDAFLAGRLSRVELSPYGISEGMRTIECRVGAQPSSWTRKDGSIWLPTARGFLEIDPAPLQQLPPPRPWIEQFRVDGKTVPRDTAIQLSPGTHEVAANFTAIRLGRAERVQFRYRIQGLDEAWVDAGGERVARVSHLRPGQFQLQVSARDPGGEWSQPAVSATIDQAPFVYQTLWFRALLAAAIAALIVALYRVRVHAVRRRYTAVLEERNRIAREWHDTLLAGLSAASWQLDVALEQCRQTTAMPSIQSALGMVRYCRDEARRAIGDLRHEHVEGLSLTDSLEQSLRQLTESSTVRSRLEVEGKLPPCGSELSSDLLRICQEAVANTLRHAHASQIVVRLSCTRGKLSLSVQDDGVGMDASSLEHPPHGHYGLLGMRERTRRFGGDLYLSSQPGQGTLVRAVVPIKTSDANS